MIKILLQHKHGFYFAVLPSFPHTENGIGNTPAEAIGCLVINNPEVFGVASAKIDLRDESTASWFVNNGPTKDRII